MQTEESHLYISWWPKCPSNVTVIDPTHECEYEARDGKLNPDAGDTGDHVQLQNMAMDTMTLTLAWALLDLDRFAEKAATLLRTWFIDPETRYCITKGKVFCGQE